MFAVLFLMVYARMYACVYNLDANKCTLVSIHRCYGTILGSFIPLLFLFLFAQ